MALKASSKYIAIQRAAQRDFLVFTNGFPELGPAVFSYDSRRAKSWEHLLQQIAELCPRLAGGKCRALYDIKCITKVCSLPELEQKDDPRLIAVGAGHLFKARYGGSRKEKDRLAAIGFEQKPYSPRPLPLEKGDTPYDVVDKTDSPIRQRKKSEPYRANDKRAVNGGYREDKYGNDRDGTPERNIGGGRDRLGSTHSLNERRRRRSDKGGGRRRASAHSQRTLIHDDATVLLSTSAVTGDRIRVKRAARTSSAASSGRQRADSAASRGRNGSDAVVSYRPRVVEGDRRGSAASDNRLRRRRPSAMAKQSSVEHRHKVGSTERKSEGGTRSSSSRNGGKSKQPSHNSDPVDRSEYQRGRARRPPSAAPVSPLAAHGGGGRAHRRRKARSASPSPRQRAQKKIIIGCFLNGEDDKFTPFKVDMVRPLPDIISDVSSHFDRYGRLAEIETGHIVSDSYELRHRAVYLFIPVTEKFKDIHYTIPGGFVIRD